MSKQFLQVKNFFILRVILLLLITISSILLFKFIQFLIPMKLIDFLMGLCVTIPIAYFLSSILQAILDFMQVYYSYDPNQDISLLTFSTLLCEFIHALKSIFEKDNCYLKLVSNLKRANTAMQEELYGTLEKNNSYSYLLEFRSNFLFQFLFDRITNNIVICTFFYVVKTDSDLTLEDYAKGAVFYHRVFPFLLTATFKVISLTSTIAFIIYTIIFLLFLIAFHSFAILPFFFIFHAMILSFILNFYILSSLNKLIIVNVEKTNIQEKIEEKRDNSITSIDDLIESDIAKQSMQSVKRKSSLSDIAKVKQNDTNTEFSISDKLSSLQSTGQSGLNSLLTQWKKNNNSHKEETVPQVKSAHKYFSLDEEQLKQIISPSYSDCNDYTEVSNTQISHEDFFLISDISSVTKKLNIDFLLHIDEY